MKLEPPLSIASRKLTHYLLIVLPRSDKSLYLSGAGYKLDNWPTLEQDLIRLATSGEAVFSYGPSFSVSGELIGPNGRSIGVKTIWKRDIDQKITKFITLYPRKRL